MKKLYGISTPIIIPFTETGDIDIEALKTHCDFLINAGVHCIYALGTTGEVFLLTHEERKYVAEVLVEHVAGRVPVYIQVGAIPTKNACDLAKHAEEIGADGVGAITPYYFHVGQRELKEYYLNINRSISEDFPMYLYNLPACTTNDLLPATIAELAIIPNIVGIKNSMGDFSRIIELLQIDPERFEVVQGNDRMLLPGLMYGAKGGVSGNSNVCPELFVKLYESAVRKDYDAALACQNKISYFINLLKDGANLAYFKEGLHYRGFKKMYTRRPLPIPTEEEIRHLYTELDRLTADMEEFKKQNAEVMK